MDVEVSRRLCMGISWQSYIPLGRIGADVSNCYDRIIHSLLIMRCQILGLPPLPLQAMFSTLQCMRMGIRTGWGESVITYGGKENSPMQGMVQGNGTSPSLWISISSLILQFLHDTGLASTTISPISLRNRFLWCWCMLTMWVFYGIKKE